MLKWLGWAVIALIVAAAAAYPVADLRREAIGDTARAELQQSGRAQQFVKLPLGVMHVRVSGPVDGPVVLLVHGGSVGGYGYQRWQKPLADAGYRVIVPDLLGYGFSDRPNVTYDKAFYTAQLTQLLDALRIRQPVHIAGSSMGGALVAAFAAHEPSRVKSVTFVAPAGGGPTHAVSVWLTWPVIGDWAFRVLGPTLSQSMLVNAYKEPSAREAMAAWMNEQTRFRGYAEGMLNTLRNYDTNWQPEDYEAVGRSGVPVLAVWGTADPIVPFAQSKVLLQRVPQTELVPLEGKSHAIAFGEADRIVEIMIPFLRQADGGAVAQH